MRVSLSSLLNVPAPFFRFSLLCPKETPTANIFRESSINVVFPSCVALIVAVRLPNPHHFPVSFPAGFSPPPRKSSALFLSIFYFTSENHTLCFAGCDPSLLIAFLRPSHFPFPLQITFSHFHPASPIS